MAIAYAIAVDGSGSVYVAGRSNAEWGNPERSYTAMDDAFVACLDSSGALTWNTFLGGSGSDMGHSVAVRGSSCATFVVVAGDGDVTWGAPVHAYSAGWDGFVVQMSSGLSCRVFLPLIMR